MRPDQVSRHSAKAVQDRIGFALCALVIGLYFSMFAAVFALSRIGTSGLANPTELPITSVAAIAACMFSCVALTGAYVSLRRSVQ